MFLKNVFNIFSTSVKTMITFIFLYSIIPRIHKRRVIPYFCM